MRKHVVYLLRQRQGHHGARLPWPSPMHEEHMTQGTSRGGRAGTCAVP